jgi:threonine/homoserine/homoserine lactone efflux protein
MTNSGLIAALGSVAAAILFFAAVMCERIDPHTLTSRVMFAVAVLLCAVYLFVSLFWGVRATGLESFQATKKE